MFFGSVLLKLKLKGFQVTCASNKSEVHYSDSNEMLIRYLDLTLFIKVRISGLWT